MKNKPIKGLYAAGRTAAGVPRTAVDHAPGMSVGDATSYGRLAGKQAVSKANNALTTQAFKT